MLLESIPLKLYCSYDCTHNSIRAFVRQLLVIHNLPDLADCMTNDHSDRQSDVVAPPSRIERVIEDYEAGEAEREAQELLGVLVQQDQYVGEVFSLGYDSALVQIHDSHRQQVGGIPGLSFLVATRLVPGKTFDYSKEDSSALLLRVMDAVPLPNDDEAKRVRVQAARQVAGPDQGHWDDSSVMDFHTAGLLSFAGVRCRVIGTFYLRPSGERDETGLRLQFGADLSNYYPNRGLKVYKPNGEALRQIVNYEVGGAGVGIGEVRYASTNRSFQGVRDVRVTIVPEDLLGQKSALFGMTRTGKSNTTKIIAKAVFDLRYDSETPRRVGQVIFDPNGEYANANAQDAGGEAPNALKNVWRARGRSSRRCHHLRHPPASKRSRAAVHAPKLPCRREPVYWQGNHR